MISTCDSSLDWELITGLLFNSKLSHFEGQLTGLAVALLLAPQQEQELKLEYNLISGELWSLLCTAKQAFPSDFPCLEGKAACPPTWCKGMLIFPLFLKESYLSPAKHRYLSWMGRLSHVWSAAAAARQSHSKYVWGGGRIRHNMTSDSFTVFQWFLFKAYLSPLASLLPCTSLPSFHPKPAWVFGVPNVWNWETISVLWPDFQHHLNSFSACLCVSCHCIPELGRRPCVS